MTTDWIPWEEQQPGEDDNCIVIFFNKVYCMYHIQYGTIIATSHWYDFEPVAWQPFPDLPDEYKKHNDKIRKQLRGKNREMLLK